MKRAYEYDYELITNAIPVVLKEEEQTWENAFNVDEVKWNEVKLLWGSHVPGSFAPERVLLAGILSMYNMGYDVTEAEKLIPAAIKAREEEDKITLSKLTARVFHILNNAKQDPNHPYLQYACYDSFEKYKNAVEFKEYPEFSFEEEDFYRRTYAGWISQIVGAAIGTAIEGYTSANIKKVFGEINDYVRKPNTYNDDITYELAFLEAFMQKGYDVKACDIAEEWVGLIPSGWSAEDIALKNIALGIYPPESGYNSNPFREWIGAQMKGAICGMAAPANPYLAAKLAYEDGIVAHHNNGVIGEIFNAMMVSMAYAEKDTREIVKQAINMVPKDSEYYSVVAFALEQCEKHTNYMDAWKVCEERYREYNWIHAYPNAAAEVVALYFCDSDFDKCMNHISMMGQDVDCNAAQIGTLFGIIYGLEGIDKRWTEPLDDELISYVRGYEKTTITAIARQTVEAVKKARA